MNVFKKKQWTRIGLSLVAVIAATLFLTGIIGGQDMTYKLGENAAAVTAAEQGFGGEVTVQMVLNGDNTVKSLAIDTPDETEGLGKRASEAEFTDQFIGKAGPFTFGEEGIEALSGATVTSNAVLKAINRLITGEEPAAEEPAAEEPSAEEPQAEAEPEAAGETETVSFDNEGLVAAEQGFGGDVTVHLVLNDDQTVKSLVIDTPNETAGLGQRASEAAFTDQFIGKAGPFTYGENGIEALSGATVTSEAALRAINALAGGEAAETPAEEPAAEQPAEEPAAEEQQETPAAGSVFKAAEQGFGGEVAVRMELNDDRTVKSLEIDTPNETVGLGQRASEAEFMDQFIGKAGPFTYGENGIEALSGATVTSNAVLKAINTIVTDGKPDAEEPAEEPAGEKPAEDQPAETPAETEEKSGSDGQVYGSYLSEKETNFSTIRVTVSTKNDVITDCKITSEAKSEGSDFLTDEIKTEWAKAIVENQGAEAEAITGATLQFSAGAVKEAVAEIQQQIAGTPAAAEEPAAGEPATEEPAEEPATEEPAAEEPAAAEEPVAEESAAEETEVAEEPAAEEPAVEEAEPEAAAEQPAEEPAAAEEAPAPAPYGGYLAVKETAFSTVRVIVSTRNGVITGCKVLCDAKEGQTDLVTDENEDAWAKAIVATQGAELDAVTGATVSSDAVREAVDEILLSIGAK